MTNIRFCPCVKSLITFFFTRVLILWSRDLTCCRMTAKNVAYSFGKPANLFSFLQALSLWIIVFCIFSDLWEDGEQFQKVRFAWGMLQLSDSCHKDLAHRLGFYAARAPSKQGNKTFSVLMYEDQKVKPSKTSIMFLYYYTYYYIIMFLKWNSSTKHSHNPFLQLVSLECYYLWIIGAESCSKAIFFFLW